ncbi:MAG: ATP-binding protein, partial [Maribacter sp.]
MPILANQALKLSDSINYKKGELEALANFSTLNLYSGKTKDVIFYTNKVLESDKETDFPDLKMKLYNELGQAYFILQDYPSSYSNFLKGLDLSEKYQNDDFAVKVNMNLGTMFSLLEDYNEAILFYSEAQKSLDKAHNSKRMEAMIFANLGFLNIQIGNYQKAEDYLKTAVNVFDQEKVLEWLAFSYTTLGKLNLKMNIFEDAIRNYQMALEIHSSLNDIKGRADIHYGLAKANLELGNLEITETYILESLELFKKFKLKTGLEKCYRLLYQLKKKQGFIAQSLDYLEQTEKLANDISKEKNLRNLKMLDAKLNFEKEKLALEDEKDIAISKRNKFLQWSLASLFTLFIVGVLILRSNLREKKLNKILESQALVLQDKEKTLKNINQNQDRLFSIVGHDLKGPIYSLKELLNLYLEDENGKEYFEKFAPKLKEDLEQVEFTLGNLLQWGSIQMKGFSINTEKIEVKTEIDKTITLFRKSLSNKSITIINKISESEYVLADINHFQIIFRNLISNAIKFTPEEGEIVISSKRKNENLIIEVRDNGLGISKDILVKLFEDNEHHSTYGTNLEKGTGLGLRLTKEMVYHNKGEITVESEVGSGTSFYVLLSTP